MYRRDFESNKNVMSRRYLLSCFVWGCYLPEGQDEVESIELCAVIRPTAVSRLHRSSRYCSFYNCTICFLHNFSLYTGYFFFFLIFCHRFCVGGADSFVLSVYVV